MIDWREPAWALPVAERTFAPVVKAVLLRAHRRDATGDSAVPARAAAEAIAAEAIAAESVGRGEAADSDWSAPIAASAVGSPAERSRGRQADLVVDTSERAAMPVARGVPREYWADSEVSAD